MARGIAAAYLEPFPTVLELSGAPDTSHAVRNFFSTHLQQPSFVSHVRAKLASNSQPLESIVLVLAAGLACGLYATHWGWRIFTVSPCCGESFRPANGYNACTSCGNLTPVKAFRQDVERDSEPELNDDGELVQEPNSSFLEFQDKVEESLRSLDIDPLSATLITVEFVDFAYAVVHSPPAVTV